MEKVQTRADVIFIRRLPAIRRSGSSNRVSAVGRCDPAALFQPRQPATLSLLLSVRSFYERSRRNNNGCGVVSRIIELARFAKQQSRQLNTSD